MERGLDALFYEGNIQKFFSNQQREFKISCKFLYLNDIQYLRPIFSSLYGEKIIPLPN